ncbi:hypothetical protein ATCC90586_000773 [Pythium insidiosum]|nr:hypothetical protein ATCC90586_000773 [Pythium insidiosum]
MASPVPESHSRSASRRIRKIHLEAEVIRKLRSTMLPSITAREALDEALKVIIDGIARKLVLDNARKNVRYAYIRDWLLQQEQEEENEFEVAGEINTAPTWNVRKNCAANFRRRHMNNNNDSLDKLTLLAKKYARSPTMKPDDPLSFGYDTDAFGNPVLGDGSDEDAFIFGITSVVLLRSMYVDPSTFILHIDTTFKLNQVEYPRTERIFVSILQSLCTLYYQATREHLVVTHVMGDVAALVVLLPSGGLILGFGGLIIIEYALIGAGGMGSYLESFQLLQLFEVQGVICSALSSL